MKMPKYMIAAETQTGMARAQHSATRTAMRIAAAKRLGLSVNVIEKYYPIQQIKRK